MPDLDGRAGTTREISLDMGMMGPGGMGGRMMDSRGMMGDGMMGRRRVSVPNCMGRPGYTGGHLRKAKSIEEPLSWLYLKGVSTGDFIEAREASLGPNAKGLSAKTVSRPTC